MTGNALPPVVAALTANITGFKAGMAEARGELKSFSDASRSNFTAASNIGKLALTGIAVGAAAVGGASIKMAGNFQESVTQLQTGAGESASNLAMVSKGMLNMASQVGTSASNLASGMYLVESAGYHGADGLNVLKAAAEGAKLGNADMKTVADGVTTALTDYQRPANDAAKVTSQLVTAVSLGKTTMGDLAGSLSTVLPQASKAGIGLEQVLGAMSTMTGQGISAQQAAQNLASTISSLQNPTTVQTKAMAQMGLSSIDVAQSLGKKGLTGTMGDLAQAIMAHMGPAGLVLQSSFNQSKLAADSARQMLTQLPASLQKTAQGFLDGTVTQKEWMATLKGQPALVANLGRQFATTAKQANGFSDQLKQGKGDAATFNALMGDMTGGQSGLNTALALTGQNLGTFQSNVQAVGDASADTKGNVKDWAEVQKDFNFKLDQAKAGAEKLGVQLGMALIPALERTIAVVENVVGWFTKHKAITEIVAGVVGGALVVAIGAYTVSMATAAAATIAATWPILAIIAAAAAVGVGIYELATHWSTIWGGIKQVADDVGKWFTKTVPAAFETAWNAIKGVWSGVGRWFGDRWDDIKALWSGVGAWFATIGQDAWNGLKSGWNDAVGFFGRIGDGIQSALKAVFDFLARGWNNTIGSLQVDLPGVGHIGMPKIPMLAAGTPNWSGGVAIVGERGPELVNIPQGSQVVPAGQTQRILRDRPSGGMTVNIEHFDAGGMSPQQMAGALEFRIRTAI